MRKPFKIDKFKSFTKKYKDSDYISKSGLELLSDSGVGINEFNRLKNQINRFKKLSTCQDFDFLGDLLLDITDNYSFLTRGFEYVSMSCVIKPSYYYYSGDIKFDVIVDVADNVADIISGILTKVDSEIDKKLTKYSDTVDKYTKKSFTNSKDERYGDKHWYYKSMSYGKISLNTSLNISFSGAAESSYGIKYNDLSIIKDILSFYIIPTYLDVIGVSYNYNVNCQSIGDLLLISVDLF